MRMRAVRSLVLACVSVVACLVILSTLTNTTPASPAALHTLVTHTHNHLNHLHNNFKEEFESFVSAPDPELMHNLGFVDDPVLYPYTNWTNLTTPVIATAVPGGDVDKVASVVALAGQICSGAMLLVYTLDLSQSQMEQVESVCNDTCLVVPFDYSRYPSHVRYWRLQAYRPIIIQELLVRAGAVLWLDPSIRLASPFTYSFIPDHYDNISSSNLSLSHFAKIPKIQPEDLSMDGGTNLHGGLSNFSPIVYDPVDSNASRNEDSNLRPVRVSLKHPLQSHIVNSVLEDSLEGIVNGSDLHALYPADQAALLHLENRYVKDDLDSADGSLIRNISGRWAKGNSSKKENVLSTSLNRARQADNHLKLMNISEHSYTFRFPRRIRRSLDVEDLMDNERTLLEDPAYLVNDEKLGFEKTLKAPNMVLNEIDDSALGLFDKLIYHPHQNDEKISNNLNSLPEGKKRKVPRTGDHNRNAIALSDNDNSSTNNNNLLSHHIHLHSSSSDLLNLEHISSDQILDHHLSYAKTNAATTRLHQQERTLHSPFESVSLLAEMGDECPLLSRWQDLALRHHGVLAWQLTDPLVGHLPTAALTHPGMFSAMHTQKHLYDFHQMSDAGAVLLYNTGTVHERLLKPWLTCSLALHCIQPIGAQDTGCRYDKKPLFRYSGCHHYDTSAFNVALGLMFGPHNHPYQPPTPPVFTRSPTPSPLATPSELYPNMSGMKLTFPFHLDSGPSSVPSSVYSNRERIRNAFQRTRTAFRKHSGSPTSPDSYTSFSSKTEKKETKIENVLNRSGMPSKVLDHHVVFRELPLLDSNGSHATRRNELISSSSLSSGHVNVSRPGDASSFFNHSTREE